MLKDATSIKTYERPTTPIGEAIEQLSDHRMSADPITEIRMPQTPQDIGLVHRAANRFGFPVEFGS